MYAVISLLMVIGLSQLVTRVAAIALMHTGISSELARFQARSAFTGVGFSTKESENVMNHPVRRKIIMMLMLLGNAGIVTMVSSLLLAFISHDKDTLSNLAKIAIISGGIGIIFLISRSRWMDRQLNIIIRKALQRFTELDIRDYASLLHLSHDFRVTEFSVDRCPAFIDKTLQELNFRDFNVNILGITRDNGRFVGVPHGDTKILPKDILLVYGQTPDLLKLSRLKERTFTPEEQKEI